MGKTRENQRLRAQRHPPHNVAIPESRFGCYTASAYRCSEWEDSVSRRHRSGSIGFDARIKTWHFVYWENGRRRSKKIGHLSQYPTKASAWRAAKPMRDAVETQMQVNPSVSNKDQARSPVSICLSFGFGTKFFSTTLLSFCRANPRGIRKLLNLGE